MTTIKNKQTGETLTGEVITPNTPNGFWFDITGCRMSSFHVYNSEWEIVPPPLPTGIGAVIKNENGIVFVRVSSSEWRGAGSVFGCKSHELEGGVYTVLSEGVTL